MNFLDAKIKTAQVTAKHLAVEFADGRNLHLPLSLFPTLAEAGPKARARWELCGAGTGIHWPLLNYDLSAAGLLRGEPEAPGIQRARKSGKYPNLTPEPPMALAEEPTVPGSRPRQTGEARPSVLVDNRHGTRRKRG